jgi:hypothetical protein
MRYSSQTGYDFPILMLAGRAEPKIPRWRRPLAGMGETESEGRLADSEFGEVFVSIIPQGHRVPFQLLPVERESCFLG